jgi:hypothetical protein
MPRMVCCMLGAALSWAPAQAQVEGPLRNQAFVPVDEGAAEAFVRGDQLIQSDPAAAVDRWFEAIAGSETGAVVPASVLPDEGTARYRAFEGVAEALLRRLADPESADAWRVRYADLASERFAAAVNDDRGLARVERRFPATESALAAAVLLSDRALARGELTAASTWLDRAERHAALGARARFDGAARRAVLDSLTPEPVPSDRIGTLELAAVIDLSDVRGPRPTPPTATRGSGLQSGMAVIDESEIVVQTASRLHLVDLAVGAVSAQFDATALVEEALGTLPRAYATQIPPAWTLQPSVRGRRLVTVLGRASTGIEDANALVCLDLPSPAIRALDESSGTRALEQLLQLPVPELRWAVDARQRVDAKGSKNQGGPGLEADAEFQPGPIQTAGTVVAAARSGESELSTHLVGLDAFDGRLRWKVLVGVGSELIPGQTRLQAQNGPAGACTGLLQVGGAVFLGTQVGLGTLVDVVDGRVRWTLLNRRRAGDERGWTGQRAVLRPDGSGLVWAPADGDHLYDLPAGPLLEAPEGPFRSAPRPIDAAFALAGAVPGPSGDRAVLLTDVGSRRALAAEDLDSDRRFETLHLFPGEPLRQGLWIDEAAVVASSDRAIYVFDPARELLLTQRMELPETAALRSSRWTRGGPLLRVGSRLLMLEAGRLTVFDLRDGPATAR